MADIPTRVLVVDDNPDDVFAVRRLLRMTDGKMMIDTAASVNDAARLMQTHEYTLIIADHYLLPETGTELLGLARTQQPDAKRILMTGHPRIEVIQEALTRGKIHGFFRKNHEEEAMRVLRANL